jgi:DNA-binding IclR family transcriptional regulator
MRESICVQLVREFRMMSTERDPNGLEIVNKSNAIISALEEFGELTVVRVAEVVDEPVSSTYRLLTSLTRIGWVDRGSRRGLYRLGLFFMRIGGMVEDKIDIRERALPSLHHLLAETGATTYLCIRRGTRAVCVERLEGRDVRSLALRLGDSLPLNTGGAPVVLLSFLPQGERDALIDEYARQADAQSTPFSRAALEDTVAAVQARGYSISDGDVTPGVAAIGAPIFNHRGELEAAISASGLHDQILGSPNTVADLVVASAAAVSLALGFRGEPVNA